jgi:hypothetical protein
VRLHRLAHAAQQARPAPAETTLSARRGDDIADAEVALHAIGLADRELTPLRGIRAGHDPSPH